MKQRVFLYLLLILCGMLALFLNYTSQQNTIADEATISALEVGYFLTLSVTPSITPVPTLNATTIFEHTAIARFTENPEAALSSTPYYGNILYNHAIRFITISPTLAPSQATPECWLYADYLRMDEFELLLMERLGQFYEDVSAEGFVNTVANIENCESLLRISNRFRVWFAADVNPAEASKNAISILHELIPQEENFASVPENILISFYFGFERENMIFLDFTWQTALEAHAMELEGDALIDYLGGLQNGN